MTIKDRKKYFNQIKPIGAIFFLVIFIILSIFSIFGLITSIIADLTESIVVCIILIIVNIVLIGVSINYINDHNNTYSDGNIDAYCKTALSNFQASKAEEVINKHSENAIDDIISGGRYAFENLFSSRLMVVGKDGIKRTSLYKMSCAIFTTTRIYYHTKTISLITEESTESQKSFTFSDITIVGVESINSTYYVEVTVASTEKVYIYCSNINEAVQLSEHIKSKQN